MTIGFASRATPYKRADLIFSDVPRLAQIAKSVGKLQIVFGGKAHPNDGGGKELIRRIFVADQRSTAWSRWCTRDLRDGVGAQDGRRAWTSGSTTR